MAGLNDILRGASHRCEYFFALVLSRIVKGLPLGTVRRMGDLMGSLLFHGIRIRRKVTLAQLARAFPEKTREEIEKYGAGCYGNLCRIAAEMVKLADWGAEEISPLFRLKGRHYLDEGLGKGKGVVLVAFHMGNWELSGAYLAGLGYPISVVAQRIHNPLIDRMVTRLRSAVGMEVILRNSAVKASIRALRRNRLVAFLADQDAGGDGVFVPFFGRPASAPRGPAVLSMHCDAPAVMVFITRQDDGMYEMAIEPVVFERRFDLEKDVEEFTKVYTTRLEEYVRAYPEQWLWQHRRWKTSATGGA